MTLPFVKMHGIGNDFIILDEAAGEVKAAPALARRLCRRRFAVGADGLVVVRRERPGRATVQFFNADGSRAEMCGNGLRCAAHYLRWRYHEAERMQIATDAGPRWCDVRVAAAAQAAEVRVGMGAVALEGVAGPEPWHDRPLEVAGEEARSFALGLGNPHLVLLRRAAPGELAALGPALANHAAFPEGTNVEWVTILTPERLAVSVYERGVGETLACGTGACAAVAAMVIAGEVAADTPIVVELPGGEVTVVVDAAFNVSLTGPSQIVYQGSWSAPD